MPVSIALTPLIRITPVTRSTAIMQDHPLFGTITMYSKRVFLNCSPSVLGEVIRPLIKGIFTAWKFLSALVGSEYLVPSSNHFTLFYDFNEPLRQSQDIPP
ncbi:UNVERIFIED_CONTAM: hypothetical protein ABIC26_003024 [Paenibacillus sp. PvR008]